MTTSDQERAAPAQQPVAVKRQQLIAQAEALLALDERGALFPHGIGGLARQIITALLREIEEPELRAEIVRLTRERDEHDRMRTLYVTSAQEEHARAEAAELRAEALSAEVRKLTEALERIDALDEASGHEMAVRHAFEAVGIARTALGEAK